MNGEGESYGEQFLGNIGIKIRDLEEKQRMLKDRLLMIGENLIETKEDMENTTLSMKKDIESLKQDMEKMISFLEVASKEFSKFARKEDLEILQKQAKMFQPLKLIRKTAAKEKNK